MRTIVSTLLIALLGAALLAAPASADDLAPIPSLRARVTDVTRTLSTSERNALEEKLAAFEQRKGAQIAILMVPTTRPETIEQYSIRVAEAWKVGRTRVDDGVIVVVAKDDHRLRIEVGYGLEGAIPDVVAKRIIREIIAPHFLAGEFHAGLDSGATALMRLIDGEALPAPQGAGAGAEQETDLGGLSALPVVLGIVLTVAFVIGGILTAILGRFAGSLTTGGIAGFAAWAILGTVIAAVGAGFVGFVLALVISGTRGGWIQGVQRGGWPGGFGGGGLGGGSWGGGGGSWSGGGGGFGGGGASGNW